MQWNKQKLTTLKLWWQKKEYLLLLFFDKCGLSFLWITRKLLHKWLTIYFSTLESPWKSSMMMTMFCAIAKKKTLTLQSTLYPHPFHFVLIWYLGVYHDGNCFFFFFFLVFTTELKREEKCPCFSSTPLTPKRNNALNHLLSGELLLSHFCFSRVDKFFKNLHFTLK